MLVDAIIYLKLSYVKVNNTVKVNKHVKVNNIGIR